MRRRIRKGRPMADITADDIKSLLAERYWSGDQYVSATEVGLKTGYSERRIDFVACHCWACERYEIEGFEIKISKPDLKRELMDPSKHNVFFDEIDKYSIVAPDKVLDDLSIIPPKWGVYKVVAGTDGKLELKTARKPMALHDERVSERKIGRPFFASLCRAVNKQSLTKLKLLQEAREAEDKIRRKVEAELADGGHIVSDWQYNEFVRYKNVCEKLGIYGWYSDMSDWQIKAFRESKNIVVQIHYLENKLSDVESVAKHTRKMVKDVLKGEDGDASKALSSAIDALEKETHHDKTM